MPVNFDALKHPRDKRGRFTKSRTVLASAKDKKLVKELAGGFQPAKAGDGKSYAGKIADPEHQSVARDFAIDAREINQDLRAGHADAAGVKPMDEAMRPLPEDLVLHRSVPATAFGGIDPQSLQGMKVRDAGFTSTQIDPVPPTDGSVRMFIAAPKGSRAVPNPDTGEVYLDRDSEMVVSHVAPNPAGGHDMYLTVLPKAVVKNDGKAPKAEPSGKPKPEKTTPKPAAEPDKPQGEDEFRAALMKQKVPDLQAQMRQRGLKPGKKRKSELVDALAADEMGHSEKPAPNAKTPEAKPSAKPDASAPAEDKVLQAINDIHSGDGTEPGHLVSLAKVRDQLGDMNRADVDAALLKLDRERKLQLEPDPNRAAISDKAKAAAIPLGGEDMHLVALVKPAVDDKPATAKPVGRDPIPRPRKVIAPESLAGAATGRDALESAPLGLHRGDANLADHPGLVAYQDGDPPNNYVGMNAVLRGNWARKFPKGPAAPPEQIHTLIDSLDKDMADSRLPRDVAVWRGVHYPEKVFGSDRMSGDLTGMQWREDAYVSTSGEERVADQFGGGSGGMRMRILVPAGASAVDLSDPKDASESELLLDRGHTFEVVTDHGYVDGARQVDVRVLPKGPDRAPTSAEPASTAQAPKSVRAAGSDRLAELARDSVSIYPRTSGKPYDDRLSVIAKRQGFDAKPINGTSAQVDAAVAAGWAEVWRGVKGGKGGTAAEINARVRDGPYEPGSGLYGNGFYTSVRRDTAEAFRGQNVRKPKPESELEPDSMLRIAIDPAAQVVDYDDLLKEFKAYTRSLPGKGKLDVDQSLFYPTDASVGEVKLLASDIGRYAAARGYDVVRIRNNGGKWADGSYNYRQGETRADQYNVLNRSVMMIEEAAS